MGSELKSEGSTVKARKPSVSIQDEIEMIPRLDEEEVPKERKTMGRTPSGEGKKNPQSFIAAPELELVLNRI